MNKYSIDTCGRCVGASDYLGSVFAVQGALPQHSMMLRCMRQETAQPDIQHVEAS